MSFLFEIETAMQVTSGPMWEPKEAWCSLSLTSWLGEDMVSVRVISNVNVEHHRPEGPGSGPISVV